MPRGNIIHTLETLLERAVPEPMSGCYLWLAAVDVAGYGVVRHDGRRRLAHRLAWELGVSPPPADMLVCHKCDVRACVNPQHLFLGTHRDNYDDMVRKGRRGTAKGERSRSARLARADVLLIRREVETPSRNFAERFGISMQQVWAVRTGKNWKHITEAE